MHNLNEYSDFDYTGGVQTFETCPGATYKIELWGAQGGGTNGGKGAYTSGNITLTNASTLYIYVGSQPDLSTDSYNGGGDANNSHYPTHDGGGATDIRMTGGLWNNFSSLKSRIMVAGGGGGSQLYSSGSAGGAAGGLTGYSGSYSGSGLNGTSSIPTGGTQISGGIRDKSPYGGQDGGFGYGGHGELEYGGGGGGSGYYGGGGGGNYNHVSAGGGGSSFISGYSGCNAIASTSTENSITHTAQPNHYDGYVFTNGVMIDGAGCNWSSGAATNCGANQPQPNGTNATGHSGSGYARITLINKPSGGGSNEPSYPKASDYLISTVGTGGLYQDSNNDYRYDGASPTNYVTFNGETWRIVGIFNTKSTVNGTGTMRVKLVRNAILGTSAYGSNNTWSGSTLQTSLNNSYGVGTAWLGSSLNATAQSYIDDAVWYYGSIDNDITAAAAYTADADGTA